MTKRHQHAASPRAICAAIRRARKSLRRRVDALAAAPDTVFTGDYPAIVAAVEAEFRQEEAAMEMLGYDRLRERREENAVVLAALHRVLAQVERGDCALGRQVLAALRDVLELHRLSTDLALAAGPRPTSARVHGRAARTTLHVASHRRHMH